MSKRSSKSRLLLNEFRFSVDQLEDRTMLSSVQILAAGDTGGETFALRIDGQAVQQFNVSQQPQAFVFETADSLTADRISIEFLNDAYDPSQQLDANLFVDYIQIDGTTYQTEDSSVFSTGTWRPEDGAVAGNGRGEYLHVSGYFQYGTSGSLVEVSARGDEGFESFDLVIRGAVVGQFTTTNDIQSFFYQTTSPISASDVRIQFLGDQYDPESGLDANLFVDFIRVDGATYHTEDSNVFSSGTWRPEDGVVAGFGRGEYLNVNGAFTFNTSSGFGSDSQVNVVARGTEGGERFRVIVDGQAVATYTASTINQTFTYRAAEDISASDVRIEFFNDQFDAATSFDRNLIVDLIQIDGAIFQTESNQVFSTGTWRAADGVVNGFGRGEILTSNGYFDFGHLETDVRYRVTFDATWSASTHPNEFPFDAHFSGLIGATHNTQVEFWSPGTRASGGIEDVAELGDKTQLSLEVNAAIANGTAANLLSGGGITLSPDSVSLEFDASVEHSLVTLVSMLAPSPDWFVGVHGLSLINNEGWINGYEFELIAYDAGTDNGTTFTSTDSDNSDGTITRINDGPLASNGSVASLGTFRFERIA